MTVAELIERLGEMPAQAPVFFTDDERGDTLVTMVDTYTWSHDGSIQVELS